MIIQRNELLIICKFKVFGINIVSMIDINEVLIQKKLIIFRISCAIMCLLLIGFNGFLIYNAIANQIAELAMHLTTLIAMVVALIIEVIINFKNLRKEVFYHPVAFNDDEYTINKMAFIFMIVISSICLILSVLFIILYFIYINTAYLILIPISIFLLIHSLMFVVYTIINRGKKFDVRDLIK